VVTAGIDGTEERIDIHNTVEQHEKFQAKTHIILGLIVWLALLISAILWSIPTNTIAHQVRYTNHSLSNGDQR
jgi:hypothetical protein